jgi:hypothetical protein
LIEVINVCWYLNCFFSDSDVLGWKELLYWELLHYI